MTKNIRPGWSNMDASADNSLGFTGLFHDLWCLLQSAWKSLCRLFKRQKPEKTSV